MLTNVGLEHTRWLGPTIADIAARSSRSCARRRRSSSAPACTRTPRRSPSAWPREQGARLVRGAGERRGRATCSPAATFQRRNFALAARRRARRYLGALDDAAVRAAAASTLVPGRFEVVAADDGAADVVLDGAHNPAGMAALAEALPASSPAGALVAVRLGPRRQGRRGDAARAAAALRRGRLHARTPTRARCRRRRSSRWPASSAGGRRRTSRPTRGARWRAARELAGPERRGARDRLDLPHRRPAAPARAPAGVDAVNDDGPSVGSMIAAVALIVALVILVFFASATASAGCSCKRADGVP